MAHWPTVLASLAEAATHQVAHEHLCSLGLGSAMAQAVASIWLRSPHLFPGNTPLPLGHPFVAIYGKFVFNLVPGNNKHELMLLVLLEYLGHIPTQSDWSISSSFYNMVTPVATFSCSPYLTAPTLSNTQKR